MKNFYPSFSARRTPLLAVVFELGAQRHIVKPITKRELKSEDRVSRIILQSFIWCGTERSFLKCRLIFADCIKQEFKTLWQGLLYFVFYEMLAK